MPEMGTERKLQPKPHIIPKVSLNYLKKNQRVRGQHHFDGHVLSSAVHCRVNRNLAGKPSLADRLYKVEDTFAVKSSSVERPWVTS